MFDPLSPGSFSVLATLSPWHRPPMALISRLLLLLLALASIAGTSEGQAAFYATKCIQSTTPTADSVFLGNLVNLVNLLLSLPSAAAPTGFATLQTYGGNVSDRALVRGLCFGGSAPEPCRRCLYDAGNKITAQCGDTSRRGGFLDERCFLGYADGANASSSVDMGQVIYFSGDAVASPEAAGVRILVALAQSLAPRAANGSVATAETITPASNGDPTTGNRTVRVVAQCARDRAAADCVGCLREASRSMAKSWGSYAAEGRVAAVLGSSCYLRFETSTPAAPAPPPPALVDKIVSMMNDHVCASVCVILLIGLVVATLTILACDRFCP